MAGTSSRDPWQSPSAAPTLAAEGPHPDRTEAVAFQPGAPAGQPGTPAGAAAPTPRSGELPAEFGRYRIERKLGGGGMGSVYLARDRELDRLVALKVPRFEPGEPPANLERFRREARAAATLDHPNICAVYDAGEVAGVQYLTMAYVEGRPLSDLLEAGTALPERPSADLVRKLALALDEAHRHGVVHRDLKPSNIMINRRHEPVITDFGLARRDRPGEEQLTQSGTILGTPAYMSPEQVEGEPEKIGAPSDVYSLGVMFYEMLTGQRPFQGSVASIFSQILRDAPRRPAELRPDLDPRLEAICLKAMSKSPAERYTMAGLAAALSEYLGRSDVAAGGLAAGSADRATMTAPAPRPAHPQAETVAMGSAPTATAATDKPVATGGPPVARVSAVAADRAAGGPPAATELGLATQLLAQLEARVEQKLAQRRADEEPRWWKNPLLPWLAAALVVLGALAIFSASRGSGPAATMIRIDLREHASDPTLVVLLDGEPLTREQLQQPIRVVSGEHRVVVKQGDTIVAGSTFSVSGGSGLREVPVVDGDELPVVKTESVPAEELAAGGARSTAGSPGTAVGRSTPAGGQLPPGVKPLPPEAVDGTLALWARRDSQYRPNPLHTALSINGGPPVRIESDLQHPIAADLRPGWNRVRLDTTPAAAPAESNDLKFRIGPVGRNEAGNPVMSPVLWSFQNGDDWALADGRYTHRIDPEAKALRLELSLYYAGLRFENTAPKDGDYVVSATPDSEYRLPSVTASVFVNGTGLNTFAMNPRQAVITPLLRKGHNEIRIVSSRVENCLTDNDVTVSISGPAEWNARQNRFQTRPIASLSAMTGWRRNQTTSRLENTIDAESDTIERVIPLYLSDEPARAGRSPGQPALSVWSERSSAYSEANLHTELRINGRLVGVFTSDSREVVEPAFKANDWNELSLLTRARHPGARLTSLKLQFGPASRNAQGELVMSPVLWWLDNGGDWQHADDRLRHQLDPDAAEVTLSARVFYAGTAHESTPVAKGDYVLIGNPGSVYANPGVTATVFINGTPLNSFTSEPRQVVITRLLKEGENEVRLVTAPVRNALGDNDISFEIAGPARYNVAQKEYEFSRIAEFTSLDGWQRDPATGQLAAADDPARETNERVLRFRITGLPRQEQ